MMDFGKRVYERIKNDLLRKLANLLDILSVFFAIVYIGFVVLLLILGFGNLILSIGLITVTALFIFFCLYKLAYLNNNPQKSAKTKKTVGRICRWTKYAMRLVTLAFAVVSLITLPEKHSGIVIASAVFSFTTLAISVVLEVFMVPITNTIKNSVQTAVVDSVKEGFKEELKETVNGTVKKVFNFLSKPSDKPSTPK